jgi:hypothetical protein
MKEKSYIFNLIFIMLLISFWPISVFPQTSESDTWSNSVWHMSIQYLGLTLHPGGGSTPEVYPLKLDRKAYFVPSVGAAANLDYRLSNSFFFRFTSTLYKDCAFLMAGCVHTGPRIQFPWGSNCLNAGIGPIFSFREDWHRFKEYKDDEFYGNRVFHGWQYRFYWTAIELEYLHKINDSIEFQWSVIPGVPLVITSMVGIRFKLGRLDAGKRTTISNLHTLPKQSP